jgi:hypothetical protein
MARTSDALRRTLASPTGWIGFLLLEFALATLLFKGIGLGSAGSGLRWAVGLGVLFGLAVFNYWVRRRFLRR